MTDFNVLEPAINPSNRISFLLDWELTMKCNLDCSYCVTGIDGGHDNSLPHPDKDQCIQTIDFMFEYVDAYMKHKPKGIRYVILNVYGGEALAHPDIAEILENVKTKYQPYRERWHLTITTTTNGILSEKTLDRIIPLIDEFTISYHSESSPKQKDQFRKNLLTIKKSNVRQKCIVLIHPNEHLFLDCQEMISWLTDNNIKYLPRQLDHAPERIDLNYSSKQVVWFKNLYNDKSYKADIDNLTTKVVNGKHDLASTGRACCGGRQLCKDTDYKSRNFFVDNKFTDWYCSVNQFFLFVKQVDGSIYTNKDCKMNFEGSVGPIGNLNNTKEILSNLKKHFDNNDPPIIQCKKPICLCGLCAPKAKNLKTYNSIIKKYQKEI